MGLHEKRCAGKQAVSLGPQGIGYCGGQQKTKGRGRELGLGKGERGRLLCGAGRAGRGNMQVGRC